MSEKKPEKEKRRASRLVLFLLLALYLSFLETLVPKPVPWFKIGFANMVTLLVLEKYGFKMALEQTALRIFIQNMALGTMLTPGFLISLTAGLGAVFVMGGLFSRRKKLSLVAISVAAAVFHNFIQLVVVWFLLFRSITIKSRYTLLFILFFLLLGVVSGAITGVLCARIRIRREA